jgi:hypothetical protein
MSGKLAFSRLPIAPDIEAPMRTEEKLIKLNE